MSAKPEKVYVTYTITLQAVSRGRFAHDYVKNAVFAVVRAIEALQPGWKLDVEEKIIK